MKKVESMQSIDDYRATFIAFMEQKVAIKDPISLYEPISYILNLGGKRLRPILALLSADIFGSQSNKALDAALAIEIFHNFSLVHDDIMDAAPMRRGKRTVHEKWGINTGILSGDAMLIRAYQLFENYEGATFRQLVIAFSQTAGQVCEGQQYDMDFEKRDDVTLPEYLKMIEYKTAVLIAVALKLGAIIAGASIESQNNIYQFGKNLGLAFQLQDDYLDAFGDPQNFGKQVGGDIMANKKTYLYLKAIELATPDQKKALLDLYSIQPKDPSDKIESIKELFQSSGAALRIQDEIAYFTQKAFGNLEFLSISDNKKDLLRTLGKGLMQRTV